MTALLLKAFAAYLLGSVSGSLLLGKLRHVDIRTMGSGNAGGTNALRTQGFWFALGVVVVDVGKGALAAGWVPGWSVPGVVDSVSPEVTTLVCGFAAVFGHCFPVFHGFRGGKGAATAVGALAVIQPWLIAFMLATWLVVVVATGYVGLSTILAALALIPAAAWLGGSTALLAFTAVLGAFIVFTHRSNIARLRAGRENRFERIRIANWFR